MECRKLEYLLKGMLVHSCLGIYMCVGWHSCCTPLYENCPQHHWHKGDPRMTPKTCGAIGQRAQVILV